ncbi:hypothetical protein KEM60_03009 [Austwickia sp. TVS 96-490-7B]|uniref:class F sortase n=1 Tax=Austwickia sp. TVS 96-490-7B TaxID=2830843 RepID=UPI001C56ADD5|nr:class F sortase [Austwickia sp. TVS 96-490-7B]MBW3086780.1 hypothetical protein [Austwickia sp. TVS 96-490-7B]
MSTADSAAQPPGGTGGLAPRRRLRRRLAQGVLVIGLICGVGTVSAGLRQEDRTAPLPARTFGSAQLPASAPSTLPAQGGTLPSVSAYGPNRLVIPSLGVDAQIRPEHVDPSQGLVIPGDPGQIGRWVDGPDLTADRGTTVLAGHVNLADRPGALHALHRIAEHAQVITTDAAGRRHQWHVDALVVRAKTDLPQFSSQGPRRLAMVTCGGPLLRLNGVDTYRDNVIAFAVPG